VFFPVLFTCSIAAWGGNRGDWRCTFVNETTGLGLVLSLFPQTIEFTGDMILQHVEPGLYSKRR
jgi:hypothetical protein